jgi:glycosyltransferase involved in cell wall biosynthesis
VLSLSVILCTSPGREPFLQRCLERLTVQTCLPDEIIIVDDGSSHGRQTAAAFSPHFEIIYLHRSNDCCPSRSRNLGAATARGEILVFLDSDMLLNPLGLAAYRDHLAFRHQDLLYGYMGYLYSKKAPSCWYPDLEVNWFDLRYSYREGRLRPHPSLAHHAYEQAWSGNFGLYRETYRQLKGFDENFIGWGGEDLEFAERAVQQGREVHFLLDAWAEHQVHSRQERFHTLAPVEKTRHYAFRIHPPLSYQVQCKASPSAVQSLERLIREHYHPLSSHE